MSALIMERLATLSRAAGSLRARDFRAAGIHPEQIRRLVRRGALIRQSRGLYMLPDADLTERHDLVEASHLVPHGVICLLSALVFHDLTTQVPHEVWMAIDGKARRPAVTYPPLRIMRFSGAALTAGVEAHVLEGVKVQVYNPAKTVADCFKYRNKIGLDVALEALRDCWRGRRATMDELWHFAQICRVANVMRPYLESLV